MATAVKRIIVPFRGASSGAEDLTWGQREIWTAMVTQRSWLPIFWVRTLAPGTSIEDITSTLRYELNRYDTMRTRLEFGTDGEPRQVVAGAGEVVLEVFEAGDADAARLAVEVQEQYRNADFDFVHDWPVRMAVVVRHGAPSHLVSVYCHLVMDGFARAMLLSDDPVDRDRDPSEAMQPMQPMQLARWERGDVARHSSAASMRHWEQLLRDIPARRFPASSDRRSPRYWEAVFRSRAMRLALRLISPRAPGATAPLLALFAVALARVTGSNPVVAQVVVSNRFRSHLADVFAPVNQSGLWAVDVADTTLDEVLSRSRRRAMSTYKHAYYDPRDRSELIARVARERGEELDIACFVNDRRMGSGDDPAGVVPTAADVRTALAHSTFAWGTRTDAPSERLFIHVEDDPDVVHLTAWTDTHHLAPGDLEAVLREMETVAVAAAFDRTASTRIGSAPERGIAVHA